MSRESRVTIIRSWDFEAAHRLPKVPKGHKCRRMHGHSYVVELHVTGPVQESGPEEGMVVDFAVIDREWKRFHQKADHHTINGLHRNPTVENVVPMIWRHFMRARSLARLRARGGTFRVKMSEGPRSSCVYPSEVES